MNATKDTIRKFLFQDLCTGGYFKGGFCAMPATIKKQDIKSMTNLETASGSKECPSIFKISFFYLMVLGITEIFSSISLLLDIFQHFSFISFGTWTLLVNKINCESFGLLQLVLLQYHRNKIN